MERKKTKGGKIEEENNLMEGRSAGEKEGKEREGEKGK